MHRTMWSTTAAGLAGVSMLAALVGYAPLAAAASARCSSGVPGDVNGDGYAEVAVGEPGNAGGRGAVHLFYGSRRGLVVDASGSALGDQYLTQDTPGVPGVAEVRDGFGAVTRLADLNGDGCADLVVGTPGENDEAGWIQVFSGSPTGLRTTGVQSLGNADLPGSPGRLKFQSLGSSLTTGDLDGDGIDDLVTSAPRRLANGSSSPGSVAVLYGSSAGLDLDRSVLLSRDTPGIGGAAEGYASFGHEMATGDFDGNGKTELAIRAVYDGPGQFGVQVLTRTATGFTGSAPISADAAGIPGDPKRFCDFGSRLASGDVHGDGRDDLVVGVGRWGCTSEEDDGGSYGPGAVVLLPGSASGLTSAGTQLWHQNSPGVQATAESDGFGSSLALAPLDRDGAADLAIGATLDGGGSVTLLRGSAAGLTTAGFGGVRYTQSTPGIPGTDEGADSFGAGITAGFLQSRTQATLVVSAPREAVGRIRNAGSITQIPIGRFGPDPSAARTFTADTPGLRGRATPNDYFGSWG